MKRLILALSLFSSPLKAATCQAHRDALKTNLEKDGFVVVAIGGDSEFLTLTMRMDVSSKESLLTQLFYTNNKLLISEAVFKGFTPTQAACELNGMPGTVLLRLSKRVST
jgi:hypothetical protein